MTHSLDHKKEKPQYTFQRVEDKLFVYEIERNSNAIRIYCKGINFRGDSISRKSIFQNFPVFADELNSTISKFYCQRHLFSDKRSSK